jgi:small subunit ribosomal protein S11
MSLPRQIPRTIKCSTRIAPKCRRFSVDTILRNDEKPGSSANNAALPSSFPSARQSKTPSNPFATPVTKTLSTPIKAPTQQFVDLFEQALRNSPRISGNSSQSEAHQGDKAIAFQPASLDQMPFQDPSNSTTIRPLPQLQNSSEQQAGYFFIHAVAVTKNLHVTICDHKHNPVIAISAGQLGKKHSHRNTPEAAYDTTVRALERLADSPYKVREVELVLKGFGNGRYGFLQAISGPKGEFVKRKVVRVTDATPLQIGRIKARNARRN